MEYTQNLCHNYAAIMAHIEFVTMSFINCLFNHNKEAHKYRRISNEKINISGMNRMQNFIEYQRINKYVLQHN